MSLETWALFALTEAVLSATPGPAVLLVLSQGLRRGPKAAAWSSGGILASNAAYFVLSGTSLGAVLVASYGLFTMIKWLGSAYLFYLGLSALLNRSSPLAAAQDDSATERRDFAHGLLIQAANPKALLFFVAILPQFLDPHRPLAGQVALLGVTSIVVEAWVLMVYGLLAGRASRQAARPRVVALTNRVGGSLLIAAALGLARQQHAR